jgi:hypothetical protein
MPATNENLRRPLAPSCGELLMLQLIFPLAAAELESTPHIPLGRGGLGPGTKLEIVRAYHAWRD